jgi:uncharacterized protein
MAPTAKNKFSRRRFLQASAGLAATVAHAKAWESVSASRAYQHGDPLHEFDYGQIQFEPGVHQGQLEQSVGILMDLNEDSLLRPYRLHGGFPAPGFELGGWYSSNGQDPGHALGQWISALSRYYAITGKQEVKDKVTRLIDGFAQTVEPSGKVYEKYRNRSYLYEKVSCGLVDAHRFIQHPDSLRVLDLTTQAALPYLPGRPCVYGVAGNPVNCNEESYTIPENQFIAWQCGGATRHLSIARTYLHDEYFDPLSRGENVLANRHPYSHVNALCSAARAYLVLGDERYLRAAENGHGFVLAQSYATGGWGPSESFIPSRGLFGISSEFQPPISTLGDSLRTSHWHFETPCGAYAHLKLTRYLLRITKDSSYGDSMERVMYNTILGALPLNKFGKAFYQADYHNHARKQYYNGYNNSFEDEWPCCSGTLPQVAADYRICTYLFDREGIFVNLYVPSTLKWRQAGVGVTLTQSGAYPLADNITFSVDVSKPVRFAIRLRIPQWATNPSVRVNGKPVSPPVNPGSFLSIHREWKSNDRVEVELPRTLELKSVDSQHPNTVALLSGPLVLFAIADDTPKVTRTQLLAAHQQGKGSPEWRTESATGPLRMIPFWAINEETYFTYLDV